jgi:hypothetical protein
MGASLAAPGSELESVQVMTRANTRAAAITQANALHALLDNLQGATINGRKYHAIESDGPPFFLKIDTVIAGLRWYYVANYHVRKARG